MNSRVALWSRIRMEPAAVRPPIPAAKISPITTNLDMRCLEKMTVGGTVVECPRSLLLQCATSIAIRKGSRRIAVIRADGFVEFYEVVEERGDRVCIRRLGLGSEYMIDKGDVVVAKAWIDGEYWYELRRRGVVALVKPPAYCQA